MTGLISTEEATIFLFNFDTTSKYCTTIELFTRSNIHLDTKGWVYWLPMAAKFVRITRLKRIESKIAWKMLLELQVNSQNVQSTH